MSAGWCALAARRCSPGAARLRRLNPDADDLHLPRTDVWFRHRTTKQFMYHLLYSMKIVLWYYISYCYSKKDASLMMVGDLMYCSIESYMN